MCNSTADDSNKVGSQVKNEWFSRPLTLEMLNLSLPVRRLSELVFKYCSATTSLTFAKSSIKHITTVSVHTIRGLVFILFCSRVWGEGPSFGARNYEYLFHSFVNA